MDSTSSIPGSGMERVINLCASGKEPSANPENDVHELTDLICYINYRQWALEDEVREPSLSAEEVVAVVKKIQTSNRDRTDTIELIDLCFVKESQTVSKEDWIGNGGIATNGNESSQLLESHLTLGQILDALSILYVRKYHTEKLLGEGLEYHPFGGYPITDALQAIGQQINLCERSFKRLHQLFLDGKAVLPPLNYFKMYGRPAEGEALT